MKSTMMQTLCVLFSLVAVSAQLTTPMNPPDNITTIVSNNVPAKILGLRWINTDTNQPVAIEEWWTGTSSIWLPLGPGASSPGYPWFYADYVRNAISHGLSIEAVTQGPVGSVVFERSAYNPDTMKYIDIRQTESFALWAMCGNSGRDFFACKDGNGKIDFWNTLGGLKVTAYAGKGGTGRVIGSLNSSITTVDTTPDFDFYLLSPTVPFEWNNSTELSQVNITKFSLTKTTPNVTIVLFYSNVGRFSWIPRTIDFVYDNGVLNTTQINPAQDAGEDEVSLYLFGRPDAYFTPTIGRHTLQATMYRKPGVVGAVRKITFDVVA